MDKKEQARLRMQRMRNKQRNKEEEDVTQSPEDVTLKVRPHGDKYPAVLYALTDPAKRDMLIKVIAGHKNKELLKMTRYGVRGPTLDIVAEMLEVT